jgi:hypothetical protein
MKQKHQQWAALSGGRSVGALTNSPFTWGYWSNMPGQISALFPTPHVRVPKQRRIFDVVVTGEVKHGLRLEARHLRLRQEVYAATSYTKEEMQYILDVHLGKYK